MTALATRLTRLEKSASAICPLCADWPTSVEIDIEYVVVHNREEARQAMAEVRQQEEDDYDPCQLGPCPNCGRTERVPVSKINYTVKED
jgi:hypothetical protein